VVECLEPFCVTYKPAKLWDIEVEVHEKYDVEAIEKRGIDSGQEVLQTLMNAFKCEFVENGEGKPCGWRQRSVCCVGARSRGTEFKMKGFESGHHYQGSDHRVGRNVPRIRNVFKLECDEAIGR